MNSNLIISNPNNSNPNNSNPTISILIVEKSGNIKPLLVKDYKPEELYKKCGFKKDNDFLKQIDWKIKLGNTKWLVTVYGKTEGRATNENKYDFPPPIDNTLFFGSCAIVAKSYKDGIFTIENLTIPLWDQFYEKLFGGFEDLATTAKEDEEEEDELANIPKERKTRDGYLKDGFVVSSDSENINSDEEEDLEDREEEEEEEEEDEISLNEIGSELSEEEYI
jgi:hypothetical protein